MFPWKHSIARFYKIAPLLFFMITLPLWGSGEKYVKVDDIESLKLLSSHEEVDSILLAQTKLNRAFVSKFAEILETINGERVCVSSESSPLKLRIVNLTQEDAQKLQLLNKDICDPVDGLNCGDDLWMRDFAKFALVKLKGIKEKKLLIIDTNRERGTNGLPKLLSHIGKDSVIVKVPKYSKNNGSGDYGGNIEVTANDILYTGSNLSLEMANLFVTKGYANKMVLMDNDWLRVGHVDEQVSVLTLPNDPCGMAIVKADPRSALSLWMSQSLPEKQLSLVAANNYVEAKDDYALDRYKQLQKDMEIFHKDFQENMKKKEDDDSAQKSSNGFVIERPMGSRNLLQEQFAIANIIDKNVQLLKAKIIERSPECKEIRTISLPVIFKCEGIKALTSISYLPIKCGSLFPNSVNMLSLGKELIVPDPIFPPFQEEVKKSLDSLDKKSYLLGDFCYHIRNGEIHCGTNELRRTDWETLLREKKKANKNSVGSCLPSLIRRKLKK
ncbi:MAG: hypothetical protein HQK50_15140 [Oligoflexia bacterium]|nr:hypothetical protein [Oligoflexia bacterium]MBF0366908.1 hypothetical protein [Oligoflexia bacterium]